MASMLILMFGALDTIAAIMLFAYGTSSDPIIQSVVQFVAFILIFKGIWSAVSGLVSR